MRNPSWDARAAFTLIELLITVAVIAVLAVIAVTLLNPTEYINRSRDSNRVGEIQSINSAVALYARDNTEGFGTPGVAYLSLVDPTATSSAGTDCSGLGFPGGGAYHCAASSTVNNINGTGWIPVDLTKIAGGSPLSQYPVDPENTSSSGEYYVYATNGITWSLESYMQSGKYTETVANEESSLSSSTYKVGIAAVPTVMYGVAANGIFSIDTATNKYTTLYTFLSGDGTNHASLVPYDGLLYGTNGNGGVNNDGTIFSFNPSTGAFTKLHDFSGTDGTQPIGALLPYGGSLYGVTYSGGSSSDGTVFAINLSSGLLTTVHNFAGTDGCSPDGSLIAYNNMLYGTATCGGVSGDGVIFSINPSSNTFAKLYDFNGSDGNEPFGNLVVYNGLLYGGTEWGGANYYGNIFSFNPSNNTLKNVYDLTLNNNPHQIVLAAAHAQSVNDGDEPTGLALYNGIIYGVTLSGGPNGYGTVFSFNPSNSTFAKLYNFTGGNDGGFPSSMLTVYDGMLYGGTYYGGSNSRGVAFSIDPKSGTFTAMHSFTVSEGYNSTGIGLVQFVK